MTRRKLASLLLGVVVLLLSAGCVAATETAGTTAPPQGTAAADGTSTGTGIAVAQTTDENGNPTLRFEVGDPQSPEATMGAIQIIGLMTVLSLAPALLMMVTSFTRIVIVLSLIRNAIGIPQLPPNQVLIGLALFLTVFVMAPVWKTVNAEALQPYLDGEMEQREAFDNAEDPVRTFMFNQVRSQDLDLFVKLAKIDQPRGPDDVPTYVLIPAFIISELKTAFQMGFILFVPFLIIDIVVSSALLSMGMMMLPPIVVSMPFKILLFVLVDGWYLVVGSLVGSFEF